MVKLHTHNLNQISYQVTLTEIHKALKNQWYNQWIKYRNPLRLLSMYHNHFTTKIYSLINYSNFNNSQCGMIIRFLSEHIELNEYLYNKQIKCPIENKLIQSPICTNCNQTEIENIPHFIMHCDKYKIQREIMFSNLTKINHRYKYRKFKSIKYILFPYLLHSCDLSQQTKVWKEILSYTKHTKRFKNLYLIDLNQLTL